MNCRGSLNLKRAVEVSALQVTMCGFGLITYKGIKGASNSYFGERCITH